MHKITIIGHLGRDPEMRYTPDGQAVTTFSVASSRKYKTAAGEQKEDTEAQNGETRFSIDVTCQEIQFLGGAQGQGQGQVQERELVGAGQEDRFTVLDW